MQVISLGFCWLLKDIVSASHLFCLRCAPSCCTLQGRDRTAMHRRRSMIDEISQVLICSAVHDILRTHLLCDIDNLE